MVRPFRFIASLPLIGLTGRSAANVVELLGQLRGATDAMLSYQTYHYHREYPWLGPRYPSRIAYWVSEVLRERALGERLAMIDLRTTAGFADLREQFVSMIDAYLNGKPTVRDAPPGLELSLCEATSTLVPTGRTAATPDEFLCGLEASTPDEVFHHLIEARWPAHTVEHDPMWWLEQGGHAAMAERLRSLQPFVFTLEELRVRAIGVFERDALVARIARRVAAYPVQTPVKGVLERFAFFHEAREVVHDLFHTRRQDDRPAR